MPSLNHSSPDASAMFVSDSFGVYSNDDALAAEFFWQRG